MPVTALVGQESPSATFIAPALDTETEFVFRLSVSDGEHSASDTVRVTISQAAVAVPC